MMTLEPNDKKLLEKIGYGSLRRRKKKKKKRQYFTVKRLFYIFVVLLTEINQRLLT